MDKESFEAGYSALLIKHYFPDENRKFHSGYAFSLDRLKIEEGKGDRYWTDGAICHENGKFIKSPNNLNGYYCVYGATYFVLKRKTETPTLHYVGNIDDIDLSDICHKAL